MNTFIKNNSLLTATIKTPIVYDSNKLVLVYDTSKEPANNTISFPVNGTSPNITVDWGDNTSNTYTTTGWKTHTYSSPGIYIVQVSGSMITLSFGGDAANTNNKLKLVRCLSFGNIGLTSLIFAFRNCTNFIEAPTILPSTITNLNSAFMDCSNFNHSNITQWNTSNVTIMNSLFDGCSIFNQPIGSWNVSNVSGITRAFARCFLFNQPLGSWNTGNFTNMSAMFEFCTNFNQPLGSWNLSKATNFGSLFRGCTNFNQPIGSWNTANVVIMSNMFLNATSFYQDISLWDIRKVTAMATMFSGSYWGISNYNAALVAWSSLPVQNNVIAGFGTNQYSSGAPATARNFLTSTKGWTITDGGLAP